MCFHIYIVTAAVFNIFTTHVQVTTGNGMDELELAFGDGSCDDDDDVTGGSYDLTDDDKLLIQSCIRLVKVCLL